MARVYRNNVFNPGLQQEAYPTPKHPGFRDKRARKRNQARELQRSGPAVRFILEAAG